MAQSVPAAAIQLPPKRCGRAAAADILAARAALASMAAERCRQAGLIPLEEYLAAGEHLPAGAHPAAGEHPAAETHHRVRVLRFRPEGTPAATLLHFHGGGYRLGCPEYVAPFAAALARHCRVEVICPAYRLAPEHPYPAALNDARTVLRALHAAQRNAALKPPFILSGDSAGGGLAAALAVLAAAEAVPLSGLVLLSAWLDLSVSAPSYVGNAATDALFSLDSARLAADLYLQGASAEGPLCSPLFAPLAGFPPAFISVGRGEVLADDAKGFHERLTAAGVSAELHVATGMAHIAVVRDSSAPGAPATFAALTAFIDAIVQNTTPAALSSRMASSL